MNCATMRRKPHPKQLSDSRNICRNTRRLVLMARFTCSFFRRQANTDILRLILAKLQKFCHISEMNRPSQFEIKLRGN
eukprot:TRINITY_DN6683_c0_g1_i1.p2 TRINITY_DN6683_c0_g1~~TRINITY_DN6683_c0_g1_i1.p2  ORF type:complete len:78 (-),score=3.28 TRINITY_DN6683_c0_g1_i1:166-399(-)